MPVQFSATHSLDKMRLIYMHMLLDGICKRAMCVLLLVQGASGKFAYTKLYKHKQTKEPSRNKQKNSQKHSLDLFLESLCTTGLWWVKIRTTYPTELFQTICHCTGLPDPSLETLMNIIEAQDTFDYAECELDQPCISQIACAKQVMSRPRPHRQSQTVNTSRPRHVKHIRQPRVQNDRLTSCPKCVLAHPRKDTSRLCLRKRKNNSSAAQPMDIHVIQSQPARKVAFKDSSTVSVGNKLVRNKPPTQPSAMRPKRNSNAVKRNVQTASEAGVVVPPAQPTSCRKQRTRAKRADFVSSASTAPIQRQYLVRGGFQPRLPTSLPPPGQQQQPSPRRQRVPLMPPAQLHTGAPRVVAPAPAVPLQSPPPSELMDVDPSAGPPSQAVAVQPVLQPLSLGTPKESDTAAPCPAPTQQPSTQRQETLPLFVGPDAPSRPVPEAAPVVTGVHPDLGFQSVFPEAPRSQCWGADRGLPPTTVSAPVSSATPAA
ncbi:uncharacterized protein LOC126232381 [Schistocerca nitens]|uniref:uncharacterized protein LOC126232372 n=1 Tax=Schistocerca nitens TaxID=7011 RepID=UPI0021173217|nr:uncharacterized protein LOC126232372 [Schistocerca nitens]XP_049798611.1 uncharacterized protein LOC126232381 [Schistocerca nitens]